MMDSTIIGEPFQLYLASNLAKRHANYDAVYTSYNPDFSGYATLTAQSDGIHIWDLRNLHAVASYSVSKHVKFAMPTFTLCVTEDGNKSITSYALIAPPTGQEQCGSTIWVIQHAISGSAVAASEKIAVHVDFPLHRIHGTGYPTVPLFLVSNSGSLFLADARVGIKNQLDWPGEREHVESFVFPRESCGFIQDDTHTYNRVAITCCQTRKTLYVRVVLLGEEIILVGTCEIAMANSPIDNINFTAGLTCCPLGILSFLDSRGRWALYQLVSVNSSLVLTPIAGDLQLNRFTALKGKKRRHGISVVSLGTSLVLLAALVEGTKDMSLQVWDLSYGVLLAAQSMPVPFEDPFIYLNLSGAGEGQALLSVLPSTLCVGHQRPLVYVVPLGARLQSSIAAALGKASSTAQWLVHKTSNNKKFQGDDELVKITSDIQMYLTQKNPQQAERAFLKWVNSNSSKEAVLGYEFVKEILNIVLNPESSTNYPYAPRIIHYLLENAVISTIMVNGRLITMLRERGDWENLMFALRTVPDVSEDELMASAKCLIDRQRKSENVMGVDVSQDYAPPLWSYLFACVSYPFSAAPMRLAIRKYISDAQDLVIVLEILENWIQGGTEREVEILLKSMARDTKMSESNADSPPYFKVVAFLHTLLDASFVTLLQYQPSHELLRRILSYVEPEIAFLDNLEPLRGLLEPFAKVQLLKEKPGTSRKGRPEERRKQKKELRQQASLSVGLYRLEELAI